MSRLAVLAIALLVAGTLEATEVAPKEFACPVCQTKFTGNVLVRTDAEGGTDSDLCQWPKGTPGLPFEVQACPSCFYAARNENLMVPIAEAVVKDLKTALEKWKEKHPGAAKAEDLSPAQRWELAGMCATVWHAPALFLGNLWLRAAWAVRQSAGASYRLGFTDPLSALETLDAMEADLKKEKDPAKQTEAMFTLAFGAHRAGDAKRRDATARELERRELDDAQKARLAALQAAFDAEKLYQERAIACFREALDKEQPAAGERHIYLFLAADMDRRLGKDAEAVKGYREVKAAGKIRRDIAGLCDFLINYLGTE